MKNMGEKGAIYLALERKTQFSNCLYTFSKTAIFCVILEHWISASKKVTEVEVTLYKEEECVIWSWLEPEWVDPLGDVYCAIKSHQEGVLQLFQGCQRG